MFAQPFKKSVHFHEICFGPTIVRFNAAKKVSKEKLSILKIRRCVILNLFHNLLFNCQFFVTCTYCTVSFQSWLCVRLFFFLFSYGSFHYIQSFRTYSHTSVYTVHSLDVCFRCWLLTFIIFIPFHLIEIYVYNKWMALCIRFTTSRSPSVCLVSFFFSDTVCTGYSNIVLLFMIFN